MSLQKRFLQRLDTYHKIPYNIGVLMIPCDFGTKTFFCGEKK
jgi:hypothetical protein